MTITLELDEQQHQQLVGKAKQLNVSPAELAMVAVNQLLAEDGSSRKSLIDRLAKESVDQNREMLDKLA